MKFVDEYREASLCKGYAEEIRRTATRPWTIIEVCGGQTHTILRYDLPGMLNGAVELIHGPGCPVCVTPPSFIDAALHIASLPGVVLCSFGDMLRVPGSGGDRPCVLIFDPVRPPLQLAHAHVDGLKDVRRLEAGNDHRHLLVPGQCRVLVPPHDGAYVARGKESVDPAPLHGHHRLHGGQHQYMTADDREVVKLSSGKKRGRGCRSGGLEPHGEHDDLACRVFAGQLHGIER